MVRTGQDDCASMGVGNTCHVDDGEEQQIQGLPRAAKAQSTALALGAAALNLGLKKELGKRLLH